MRIFIEPTEPLLFRTGRPFAAGENNFAESMFPPTPETLQGAVRATIAAQWGRAQKTPVGYFDNLFQREELVKLIGRRTGERDTYGQFRITGLTLGRRNPDTNTIERLFPAPSHIIRVTLKDEQGGKFQRLVLLRPEARKATTNMPSNLDLLFPLLDGYATAGKSEPVHDWLTPRGLKTILHGDLPPDNREHLIKSNSIYVYESRLGIGMQDRKKTTKEGYLYQAQMVRMQPGYGIVVDVASGETRYGDCEKTPCDEQHTDAAQDLAFLRTGWLTLGGEQRAAHFTALSPQDCAGEDGITQTEPGNLLYFATPTYFKQGWLPEETSLLPAQPISASINRHQSIGGWYLDTQSAGGGHKMMRRCIPAGSVYFFNQKITVDHPLTEYGWQIGYGIAYTGEWKS